MIRTDTFCQCWAHIDYSFNVAIIMLMSFGSIERYLLVVHRNVVQRHVIIMHYLPIVLCILYPFLLYLVLIFFYPCVNRFNFAMITCGGPCYLFETVASTLDQFVDIGLPLSSGAVANAMLFIQVLRQKRRMKIQRMWTRNRRLILQLLSLVLLHSLIWFPMLITTLIMLYSSSLSQPWLVQLNIDILPNGIYIVILLQPFISMLSLPEVWPRSV